MPIDTPTLTGAGSSEHSSGVIRFENGQPGRLPAGGPARAPQPRPGDSRTAGTELAEAVKIPDACAAIGATYMDPFEMMRRTGQKLVLGPDLGGRHCARTDPPRPPPRDMPPGISSIAPTSM